ncbi:MAG: flagellar hook-basal body complex protein FliE [Pseudomonadales bacterium]|nr:flagellar hook-basal body complex protein FliE [Pseudomonadales bacterium]
MDVKGVGQPDIQMVLAQMRALRTQAQAGAVQTQPSQDVASTQVIGSPGATKVDFGETLKGAIDNVNSMQQTASSSANDFIAGRRSDLVNVMVDGQKASLGFQAMVQVRNRMVSAYQDIMNMPI